MFIQWHTQGVKCFMIFHSVLLQWSLLTSPKYVFMLVFDFSEKMVIGFEPNSLTLDIN